MRHYQGMETSLVADSEIVGMLNPFKIYLFRTNQGTCSAPIRVRFCRVEGDGTEVQAEYLMYKRFTRFNMRD